MDTFLLRYQVNVLGGVGLNRIVPILIPLVGPDCSYLPLEESGRGAKLRVNREVALS
jgi:hypothetical protein